MVCDACRTIDLDSILNDRHSHGTRHHHSYEDLENCAHGGNCQLCEVLLDGLKHQMKIHEVSVAELRSIWYKLGTPIHDMKSTVEEWHGICHILFQPYYESALLSPVKVHFDLLVSRESDLARRNFISGRPIARCADDPSCFNLAKEWINNCETRHEKSCRKISKMPLPTRVIDVGESNGSQKPCLRITRSKPGVWVALSHCWGMEPNFLTNAQNIQDRQRGLSMKDMPKTFSDAVIVTRQLGYQYLWIDSLCIIQGDEQDWVSESIRMRDYYRSAALTISADSASGDHIGFLNERNDNYVVTLTLKSGDQVDIRTRIECKKSQNRDTFISQRAWTLQEFVLSPRSLLYTTDQLVFECETRRYSESDENSQGDGFDSIPSNLKRYLSAPSIGMVKFPGMQKYFEPTTRWYNWVNDYSIRSITHRNDILPALSGLAKEIQIQTKYTYAAGIWIEELHAGLLWKTYGCGKPSEVYCAPSWSWAALDRVQDSTLAGSLYVSRELVGSEVRERRVCLKNYKLDWTDGDQFGRLSFGSILLRGKSLPAKKWPSVAETHFNFYKNFIRSHQQQAVIENPQTYDRIYGDPAKDQLICWFDVMNDDVDVHEKLNTVTLLQISTWEHANEQVSMALMLCSVGGLAKCNYRRVGIAEVPNYEGLAVDGWEERDFCII